MRNLMHSRLILVFEDDMTQPVLIISMKTSLCRWNVSSSASAPGRNQSTTFAFFYNFAFWLEFSIALCFLGVWSWANAALCPPQSHTKRSRCISYRRILLHSATWWTALITRVLGDQLRSPHLHSARDQQINTSTSSSATIYFLLVRMIICRF